MATVPTVSVIIPAYNSAETLAEAIASAQRQTLSDIEIIVVDDGSTDDTPNIIKNLAAQDPRIKSITLAKNAGVSHARNIAIKQAAGEWIAVLDADDLFEPPRLEKMCAAAKEADADVLCDNLKIRDYGSPKIVTVTEWHEGKRLTSLTPQKLFNLGFPIGPKPVPIGLAKPLIKAGFLQKNHLLYNERLALGEDNLLLAELFLSAGRIFFMPEAYYIYLRRVSPLGKISPVFCAPRKWEDLIKLCDVLLEKYAGSLSGGNRRKIVKRRKIVSDWVHYMKFRETLNERELVAAITLYLRKPIIITTYIITAFVRKIRSIISICIIATIAEGLRRRITEYFYDA